MALVVAAIALALGLSSSGHAADAALEINQACALNEGCFAGDTPGLPVTITASGRYRLTGDLVIPDLATRGISVQASQVDLDLNGFTVRGPSLCDGAPLVCLPGTGTGAGIEATTGNRATRVRNGTVRGAGGRGISLQAESVVEDVRVRWNRGIGVVVGESSAVEESIVHENGGGGIVLGRGGRIAECVVSGNGSVGITLDELTGDVGAGSVVSSNVIYRNDVAGIFVDFVGVDLAGSGVVGNTVYDNGAGVVINQGGNVVNGNVIVSNTNTGLLAGTSSLTDNTITGNGLEVGAGTGSFLGGNSCDGTATCP